MKQKIVVEMRLDCDKCRSKALKMAGAVQGVTSVSLDEDNNKVVVTGNNVNTICLANHLNKKFRRMKILSVEEVKTDPENNEEKQQTCCCNLCINSNDCAKGHAETIIICSKCKSPKCSSGHCSPKPHPYPYHIHHCPPRCTSPRCYCVVPPGNIPPCTYRVVYDSYNDGFGCSIM